VSGPIHILAFTPCRLLIALSAALLSLPGQAQHQGHGGYGGPHGGYGWHGGGHGGWHGGYGVHGGYGWRGGPAWRRGYWYHGAYGGRGGWWWVVGPSWYYYPAPVYPYPAYPVPYWPPQATALPPGYLFYCPSFLAYYAYVAPCPGGGTLVPAGP
jgi:hypothetical protein